MPNFEERINNIVDLLVRDVTRHVEGKVRDRVGAQLPAADRMAKARAAKAAKGKATGKRGRRHCRKCGSIEHDLRNHGKKAA